MIYLLKTFQVYSQGLMYIFLHKTYLLGQIIQDMIQKFLLFYMMVLEQELTGMVHQM